MALLPTGTVTFLFADIEGSTDLLQQFGSGFAEILETHQRLLRAAFSDGVEIGTEGDSFFVAFDSATKAVAAAVAAQVALAAHEWPAGRPVRVRMGLHTGQPSVAADNYVGLDVHRAARIAAAGHGGQVLISESTDALVRRDLPDGVTIRDLGQHRLKDLAVPEHLFQLVIPDLPADFPALRSLDARPNNLPTPPTSFVGRAALLVDARLLLSSARLLTFTGPGGSGKTRLALEVGALELGSFVDGVFLVPLATIRDADLVPSAVAQVLGVKEAGRSISEAIIGRVRDAALFLILDNFEQVLAAASFVGEMLQAAPRLRILITSRTPLRIGGEQEFPVPPLEFHAPIQGDKDGHTLPEAVELFAERARAVDPSFRLTESNTAEVAAICSKLDGLPLAIELAAARVRVLGPKEILDRLDRRLDLLTGGTRDQPARQQTLRGAIDWSHDLLTAAEQSLFCRASVFVGGWSLEAMEAVCGPSVGIETGPLETLTSLIEQNLVQRVPGQDSRYSMLETIREYARERLDERGEAAEIAARHAAFYVALAERAAPELEGGLQEPWLDRLALDLDNLRASIRWAVDHGDADLGLRITVALHQFWVFRDGITEGRQALRTVLVMPGAASPSRLRASAANAASNLATWQGDFASARALIEESLAFYRAINDDHGMAGALNTLGWAAALADPTTALAAFDESAQIARKLGDDRGAANGLLGGGQVGLRLGDLAGARRRSEESLRGYRRIGDRYYVHFALANLGRIAHLEGNLSKARALYVESVSGAREAGATLGLISALELLADLVIVEGQPEGGVKIAAAVARHREEIGGGPSQALIGLNDHRETARLMLDEATVERAWAEGRQMSLDQATDYALKGE